MMRYKIRNLLLLAGVIITLGACKNDEPLVDPTPVIQIESLSATTVQQFVDDFVITLAYEDGDGDLGFYEPDSMAVYVWDSRLTQPEAFHLRPLTPPDEELIIQGTIDIKLNSVFMLGNGTSETVNYRVKIKDRAGNWSNEVQTEDITITQ